MPCPVPRYGKAHKGVCAVAVASFLCGLNTAPLEAQPMSWPADVLPSDSSSSFDERFSADERTLPFFMRPEIHSLLESLPFLLPPADAQMADNAALPSSPEPTTATAVIRPDQAMPPPPDPAEVVLPSREELAAEATASLSDREMPLPDFPPPPDPAEVVLPSREELAAVQPQAPPSAPTNMNGSGTARSAEVAKPSRAQTRTAKRQTRKSPNPQKNPRARQPVHVPVSPPPASALPDPRTSATCLTPEQTFAIIFGFLAGGLLAGPIGAIALGTAAAAMNSPEARQAQQGSSATMPAGAPRGTVRTGAPSSASHGHCRS